MFQLVLGSNSLSAGNRRLVTVPCIFPDTLTCNLRHRHMLEMEMSVAIAGENHTAPMSADS